MADIINTRIGARWPDQDALLSIEASATARLLILYGQTTSANDRGILRRLATIPQVGDTLALDADVEFAQSLNLRIVEVETTSTAVVEQTGAPQYTCMCEVI